MIIPFATQSYRLESTPISGQRCINMYAEKQPEGAKSQVTVQGVPGISTFATCGAGPIRGMYLFGGLLYVVSGGFLYSITNASTPVVTQLGGQILGSGPVEMSDNGVQIGMVNGTNGYIYTTTGGFQLITDTNFQNGAQTITFCDGVFLFDWPNTNQVFISNLLDGTTYNALAFGAAESHSDFVLAIHNLQEVLYILKQQSMEIWQDVGAINFPFQRIPGGVVERGIMASHARAMEDQALFFIGNDRIGYRLNGLQPVRNTTHAIEQAWRKYATVSDCIGMRHTWNGHKFIYFTFPSMAATWGYDIATGLWHERESRDLNGNTMGRWRANCLVEAYGKTMVGDSVSGQIGYLDGTVNTEFGNPIYAQAIGPVLHASRKRAFMSLFELDMETGIGLSTGQGANPQVMLDISDDGGRNYSPLQMWQSLGQIGKYTQRLRWKRLGNFYQRIMRVTISDPVRRTIIAANADITVGM